MKRIYWERNENRRYNKPPKGVNKRMNLFNWYYRMEWVQIIFECVTNYWILFTLTSNELERTTYIYRLFNLTNHIRRIFTVRLFFVSKKKYWFKSKIIIFWNRSFFHLISFIRLESVQIWSNEQLWMENILIFDICTAASRNRSIIDLHVYIKRAL